DVIRRGHTAGVEGAHRQLRTGLADGLGGDDAHSLADVDPVAGGHGAAVAGGAGPHWCFTGEHRTDPDGLHTGLEELVDQHIADFIAGLGQHVARGVCGGFGEDARVGGGLHHLVQLGLGVGVDVVADVAPAGLDQHSVGAQVIVMGVVLRLRDRYHQAAVGAAVLVTDDDVLGDVDQTTGQVAGVGRLQRSVGQTLASTVGSDEVFQNRQALSVGGLDRPRHDVTLGVGHQATDAGDLADLVPVSSGTGGDRAVDVVQGVHPLQHRLLDLVGGLGPDLLQLLGAVVLADDPQSELFLHFGDLSLVLVHDGGLV